MPRRGKGRKKVEIVKIPDGKSLQVSFSKRRGCLFKKANELSTMCGAEIAIVGYTPGKNVYSFGHPCVNRIVDRFLAGNPPQDPTEQLIESYKKEKICKANKEVNDKQEMLDMEIKHKQELQGIKRAPAFGQHWWEAPLEDLNTPQLEQMEKALDVIKEGLGKKAQRQQMINGAIFPFSILGSALTPPESASSSKQS